jgi:hypothetical protein
MVQPLASSDSTQLQSDTNLSTSLSLTILGRNGNQISVGASIDHPIELIIPRDPNLIVPSMSLQNVTSMNATPHNQVFNLHLITIPQTQGNNNRTVSLIFEMNPLNKILGYLLIYRFDNSPQLNSSINQIDGWSLFCPLSKFYSYLIL